MQLPREKTRTGQSNNGMPPEPWPIFFAGTILKLHGPWVAGSGGTATEIARRKFDKTSAQLFPQASLEDALRQRAF
jgi:hypothetical protein